MTSDTPNTDYATVGKQLSPQDEKLWSTLIHLAGLLAWVLGLTLGGFIPALIGYLILKDRGPFVRSHTAAAFNFQLSLLIYTLAAIIISLPLMIVLVGFLTIWLIPLALSVLNIIFSIIAAVKANKGQFYTYPLAIPFVS